jgi:hypothetical protein
MLGFGRELTVGGSGRDGAWTHCRLGGGDVEDGMAACSSEMDARTRSSASAGTRARARLHSYRGGADGDNGYNEGMASRHEATRLGASDELAELPAIDNLGVDTDITPTMATVRRAVARRRSRQII